MINYIRHDEQFHGVCKLSIGEEILGEIIVTEDPETHQDLIFIQHPAKTKVIEMDGNPNTKEQKVAMGFIKWMNFSDEDFYVLNEKDIMTIAPMSPEAIMMYKRWVRKEIQKIPEKDREVPMNESMGLITNVESARKILEKIFNNPQLPKD
jgi:hypothetical protein|tara:strand:+ start:3041 stop:3493 length:453 start_codon:yes stop_codon:yes gene_type:complete